MALTRITRGVIKPNENYDTHNIVSTGIVTSVGLDVNGNADVSGNLSVGGVLTYEDVTSIDSIGIITARSGIDADDFISVGSNIHLGNAGVITATSFVGDGSGLIGVASTDNIISGTAATFNTYPVDINAGMTVAGVSTMAAITATTGTFSGAIDLNADLDVDGHTNLDNVSVAGVVTATTFVGSLTGNSDTFTVTANNSTNETVYPVFVDGATGSQGAETDTGLTYNPSTGNLTSTKFTGDGSGLTGITASGSGIVIKNSGSTVGTAGTINFGTNLDVSAISGGSVTVTATAGISTISGVVNIANDLDVDGHTN